MNLAWDTPRWTNDRLDKYTRLWAEREFGGGSGTGILPVRPGEVETHGQDARATIADEIAEIISTCTKFNGRRKPELLAPDTYSLVNYGEFEKVVADCEALAAKAEAIGKELPPESRDAYYELVLFPAKAGAGLNAMYLAAGKNALYAKQGRASANDFAAQTRVLFQAQTNLMLASITPLPAANGTISWIRPTSAIRIGMHRGKIVLGKTLWTRFTSRKSRCRTPRRWAWRWMVRKRR